ncbi:MULTISPECIES: hypothetical protein [Olivibacter]|uniref:Protein CR006 P-loop domain-containing protein n=1 Tax=Olivibacter jilunii TaxID=985016 RepID=A0ABW6B2S5_9SPHI
MNTLSVNLENCFGIGKLKHDFEFGAKKSNTFLIYAPNGTMKSSFAKTFDALSKNDSKNPPCDRVYRDKQSKYEVLVDGSPIPGESILVVNAEDSTFDASNKISAFIASKELKERYDTIYKDLEAQKTEFIKRLRTVSQSTDCEGELIGAFTERDGESFFDVLERVSLRLKDKVDKYSFRYNDVFDKKGNVIKFLDKNEKILDQYVNDYKSLLANSKFFKESDKNSFGTYQANELLKSIEDNSFFDAGHKFILDDGTEITNSESLRQVVQDEIAKIINDAKLKAAFEKIDKAIGANMELRAFQKVVERNNLLLVELKDYDAFREKVWISYLSEMKEHSEELAKYYESKKAELKNIIEEAKKEFVQWKKIVSTFNDRFYVPFKVLLTNQEDIILKQMTAKLEFEYSDSQEVAVRQKGEDLLKILSKGEQRAYFILQFLFEIESRRHSPNKSIIIFDDVADSFDYKNKFAIIEYIRELHNSDLFRIILLTHNFDFYRTIASRFALARPVVYMATKSNEKEIFLHIGAYRKDVFDHFLKNINKPKIFISSIAFVRNIVEYADSDHCSDYEILTSCLHLKENSYIIKVNDVYAIYVARFGKLVGKTIDFGDDNLIDFVFKTADSICDEQLVDEILLENKISLAIAIRLKAEGYLIKKLPDIDLEKITSKQTNELYQIYRDRFPESGSISVLDRVNLMTPENIHINAFMYEPLIDMSVFHLRDLYERVKLL